ncbi:unnamed protein product [Cyprideis torosa]|uniref:Uncharacterized protein n=1 Tax=Cyprideis torosa TaxID=163714 RepID=A0A7R8W5Y3_9CRUS|nr:unnamed protein product [Cyprideis torosa]CAG0885876.1 unnamed protein product [Cyprideis torosa]
MGDVGKGLKGQLTVGYHAQTTGGSQSCGEFLEESDEAEEEANNLDEDRDRRRKKIKAIVHQSDPSQPPDLSITSYSGSMNLAVKLRSGMHEDRSSSGNWSASSSTRTSFDSDTHASKDLERDSGMSSGPGQIPGSKHGTSSGHQSGSSRRRRPRTAPSEMSDLSFSTTTDRTLTPELGITGVLPFMDDEASSVYSCDTEGYYTSFHVDSGVQRTSLTSAVRPSKALSRQLDGVSEHADDEEGGSDHSRQKGPPPKPPPRMGSVLSKREEPSVSPPPLPDADMQGLSFDDGANPNDSAVFREKTAIRGSRIPSLCAITPPGSSDEEAGKGKDEDRLCSLVSPLCSQSFFSPSKLLLNSRHRFESLKRQVSIVRHPSEAGLLPSRILEQPVVAMTLGSFSSDPLYVGLKGDRVHGPLRLLSPLSSGQEYVRICSKSSSVFSATSAASPQSSVTISWFEKSTSSSEVPQSPVFAHPFEELVQDQVDMVPKVLSALGDDEEIEPKAADDEEMEPKAADDEEMEPKTPSQTSDEGEEVTDSGALTTSRPSSMVTESHSLSVGEGSSGGMPQSSLSSMESIGSSTAADFSDEEFVEEPSAETLVPPVTDANNSAKEELRFPLEIAENLEDSVDFLDEDEERMASPLAPDEEEQLERLTSPILQMASLERQLTSPVESLRSPDHYDPQLMANPDLHEKRLTANPDDHDPGLTASPDNQDANPTSSEEKSPEMCERDRYMDSSLSRPSTPEFDDFPPPVVNPGSPSKIGSGSGSPRRLNFLSPLSQMVMQRLEAVPENEELQIETPHRSWIPNPELKTDSGPIYANSPVVEAAANIYENSHLEQKRPVVATNPSPFQPWGPRKMSLTAVALPMMKQTSSPSVQGSPSVPPDPTPASAPTPAPVNLLVRSPSSLPVPANPAAVEALQLKLSDLNNTQVVLRNPATGKAVTMSDITRTQRAVLIENAIVLLGQGYQVTVSSGGSSTDQPLDLSRPSSEASIREDDATEDVLTTGSTIHSDLRSLASDLSNSGSDSSNSSCQSRNPVTGNPTGNPRDLPSDSVNPTSNTRDLPSDSRSPTSSSRDLSSDSRNLSGNPRNLSSDTRNPVQSPTVSSTVDSDTSFVTQVCASILSRDSNGDLEEAPRRRGLRRSDSYRRASENTVEETQRPVPTTTSSFFIDPVLIREQQVEQSEPPLPRFETEL